MSSSETAAIELDDLWADLFQYVDRAFEELGGSKYGPQWMVLAMVCQLYAEAPESMIHMWSIMRRQPGMEHYHGSGSILSHLKEILERAAIAEAPEGAPDLSGAHL